MTTPALALEQILLDPRLRKVIDQVRQHTPVHQLDQADAATEEAARLVVAVGQRCGFDPAQLVDPGDVPSWLRISALDAYVGYAGGKADTCSHSPIASHPQPVYAALWRPGLITCARCTHLFALSPTADAGRTCDHCGRVCDRTGPDVINAGMLQLGPLAVQYGACSDCDTPVSGVPLAPPQPRTSPRGNRGKRRGKGRH